MGAYGSPENLDFIRPHQDNEEIPELKNIHGGTANCPHCGRAIRFKGTRKIRPGEVFKWILVLSLSAVLLVIAIKAIIAIQSGKTLAAFVQEFVGVTNGTETPSGSASSIIIGRSDYISQCEIVEYDDLAANPDSYAGKKISMYGSVFDIQQRDTGSGTILLEIDGNALYVTFFKLDESNPITEGEQIICYGVCNGTTTYTSTTNKKVTLPSMRMVYYDVFETGHASIVHGEDDAGQSSGATEPITLTSGNYIAGVDFPAGTYTIVAKDGTGYVQSSNAYSGGIYALMASEEDMSSLFEDLYTTEYKNVRLPADTELTVNGLTIELVFVR